METDEVVSAVDAGIEAADNRKTRNTSSSTGADNPTSSRSRTKPNHLSATLPDSEVTPLLADDGNGSAGDYDRDASGWVDDFSGLPWYQQPSVFWMLIPFALFTLSFGGTLVPKLNLILDMVCRDYLADKALANGDPSSTFFTMEEGNPQCKKIPEVQSRVADFQLYANIIGGSLAAIVAPRLGALSDSYGRKGIIVLTMSGTIIGEIIAMIAAFNVETFPSYVILLGYAADGLCGSFTTAMAITHSYASDCTPPKKRGVVFGYFHACLFTGIALGPLLAGFLVKLTGNLASIFLVAAVISFIVMLFIALAVPESLSKERQFAAREKRRTIRAESDWRRSAHSDHVPLPWLIWNFIKQGNPFPPLKILWPTGEGSNSRVRRNLVLLALLDTITFGIAMGSGSVIIYYSEYQFGWDTFESSIFLSVVSITRVFALLVALPVASRLIRGKSPGDTQKNSGSDLFDLSAIRLAFFVELLGYVGYSVARTGLLFTISAAVASLGGIASPTLQSAITKHVPRDRTGQVLGATGLLHALARVVGPTIFNGIYRSTVKTFPQTLFVCLVGAFAVAFIVSWFILPHVHVDAEGVASSETRPSEADGEADPALER